MSIKKDGIMVILSSPSGAGKTTLVKLLSKIKIFIYQYLILHENQDSSEIADQDYYFVNHEKFERFN